MRRLADLTLTLPNSATLLRLATLFCVSLAAVLVLGQTVLAKGRTPRVVLLGSGDRLSALIVVGNARMLIAAGTNGESFLNAFAEALPFADRHVDLLVLAGDRSDLPVAASARHNIAATKILVLDGRLSTSLDDLELDATSLISGRKRIALSPEIAVTLSTSNDGWQAIVEHGQTRVRIVSDAEHLDTFRETRSFSALVVTRKPSATKLDGSYLSLVLPGRTGSLPDLVPGRLGEIPVVNVDNGRAAVLVFERRGLKLPNAARPLIRPTTQAGNPPRASIAASNSTLIASRRDGFVSTSYPVSAIAFAVRSVLA